MDDMLLSNDNVSKNIVTDNVPRNISTYENNSFAPNHNNWSSEEPVEIFNITATFGPQRDSLLIVIPITIIYVIIFVTGVIGNISTCIVIKKNRSMHTATNYYLFSLAISDFLLLLSGVPQEIYFIWSKYPYVFGEIFCIGRGFIAETSANATVLTITAFTAERYVAICHPFLAHAMSKLNRATRIVLVIWFTSFLTAIPQAAQFGVINFSGVNRCVVVRIIIEHSFQLSTFIFFFAPMSIILVLYLLIGVKLYRTNIMRSTNGNILYRATNANSVRTQSHQGTKRVLKMLVAVVIAFFICWAPFHAQRLIAVYGEGTGQKEHDPLIVILYTVMTYVSGVLYYLSTCINPLLYNIMSNKFREAFKETLDQWNFCSSKTRKPEQKYNFLSGTKRLRVTFQESTDYTSSSQREESFQSTSSWKYNDQVNCGLGHSRSFMTIHESQLREHTDIGASSRYSQSVQRTSITVLDDQCSKSIVKIDKIDLPSKDASLNVIYTQEGDIEIRLLRKSSKKSSGFMERFCRFCNCRFSCHSSNIGFYTPPIEDNNSSMYNLSMNSLGKTTVNTIENSNLQNFERNRQLDALEYHTES